MTDAQVRFDDSLPRLVDVIVKELGQDALTSGVALRDITGRLCFFTRQSLDEAKLESVATRLRVSLGRYARPDRVVADSSGPGASSILADASAICVLVGDRVVSLVDRRLVGADWLRKPAEAALAPQRFVFTSLKGGVGRSTALSVTAAHLARQGYSVLVIDFDLEAPGLGALLLNDETAPEFGTLDFLVETNLDVLDDLFLADLVGPSGLSTHGGRIDVVPAFGRCSLRNPADVLAKIGRAYLEYVRPDGFSATIFDKIRDLVDRLAGNDRYDAVLIDARAGLHETTAAAILGLGADVFLFGLDEPQTFQGYAPLFAHLTRLTVPGAPVPDWVDRLTPVHAKAPADAEQRMAFEQRWQQMVMRHGPLSRCVSRTATEEVPLTEEFKDVPWDEAVPDEDVLPRDWSLTKPLAVLRDERYLGFDPLRLGEQLESTLYVSTFGDLLQRVQNAISADEEAPL